MKRILLLLVILFAGICASAQSVPTETVYLSNGSIIKGTVVEQTKNQVKIKTSDGSVFVYETSQVERIVKNQTESFENRVQIQENYPSTRPFIKGVRFNGYFDMNLLYTKYSGANVLSENPSLSLGVRIFDYGYVGVKSGIELVEMFYKKDSHVFLMVPLMADFRGYFPINADVHPYMEFAFGNAWVIDSSYIGSGWRHNLGAGFDIKRFSLGMGWNKQGNLNRFYFKIGVKLGGQN